MAVTCGKHDVTFPEGGKCWCCEQAAAKNKKKTQEEKPKNVPSGDGDDTK